MFSIRTVFLTTIVFLAAQTCSGVTDVPDLFLSEAFITYSGSGTVSLLVVPDGNGNPFTEAHDEQGNVADATITLYLRDAQGMPFVLFPHEDMWLETDGGVSAGLSILPSFRINRYLALFVGANLRLQPKCTPRNGRCA